MTIFERLRSRPALLVMLLSAVALVATACLPANPPPEPGPAFPPFGGLVETNPGLFPHFSTGITDYVSRCNLNQAVLFSVNAPPDTTVSVDGQPPDTGQFNTFTFRDYNQSFTIVVQTPQATTTHYVRCLPPDFPDWSVQRPGTPQAGFYLTSPTGTPVIFDNNGVPMWWWTSGSRSTPSTAASSGRSTPSAPTATATTPSSFPTAITPWSRARRAAASTCKRPGTTRISKPTPRSSTTSYRRSRPK